jgi:cytochrome c oxidase subunit 2
VMRTRAIVMTEAGFAAYMTKATTPQKLSGLAVFNAQGCNGCHVLSAAKSTGTLGPSLDYLATYAKRAGKPLAAFIRESILSPGAYIEPGCPKAMPPNYKDLIAPQQLDALVSFLAQSGTKATPHKGCG